MARLPHPNDKPQVAENSVYEFRGPEVDRFSELEEHIQNADHWASDWGLRELKFEAKARRAEHGVYIAALQKVCHDYGQRTLKTFPVGVARWLSNEAGNVCRDLPSQVLKKPR